MGSLRGVSYTRQDVSVDKDSGVLFTAFTLCHCFSPPFLTLWSLSTPSTESFWVFLTREWLQFKLQPLIFMSCIHYGIFIIPSQVPLSLRMSMRNVLSGFTHCMDKKKEYGVFCSYPLLLILKVMSIKWQVFTNQHI